MRQTPTNYGSLEGHRLMPVIRNPGNRWRILQHQKACSLLAVPCAGRAERQAVVCPAQTDRQTSHPWGQGGHRAGAAPRGARLGLCVGPGVRLSSGKPLGSPSGAQAHPGLCVCVPAGPGARLSSGKPLAAPVEPTQGSVCPAAPRQGRALESPRAAPSPAHPPGTPPAARV